MELTERQKLTVKHISQYGIKTDNEIVAYCKDKLSKPHKGRRKAGKLLPGSQTRGHSREHYQGILDYFSQK